MATKSTIARKMYGVTLSALSSGEKAAVTKAFNAQGGSTGAPTSSAGSVKAEIGRSGVNGVAQCILPNGSTMSDLLKQAKYGFDPDKESIKVLETGETVELDDEVVHQTTYVITEEITSA